MFIIETIVNNCKDQSIDGVYDYPTMLHRLAELKKLHGIDNEWLSKHEGNCTEYLALNGDMITVIECELNKPI